MILAAMVGAVSASFSQTWYLSSSQDSNNRYEEIMWKASLDHGTSNVEIIPLQYNIWIANEPAECDVDLSGTWTGHLKKRILFYH